MGRRSDKDSSSSAEEEDSIEDMLKSSIVTGEIAVNAVTKLPYMRCSRVQSTTFMKLYEVALAPLSV
jgi:hypothetical protein